MDLLNRLRQPGPALADLYQRLRQGRQEPPQVEAEYLRLIFRNQMASSPISLAMVIYLASQVDPQLAPTVRSWAIFYGVYICIRLAVSMAYPRQRDPAPGELRLWSFLSVLIQAGTGFFMAVLGLYVVPTLDLYSQIVASMVVLIMVGAAAFSLSGRWVDTLVFAPPVYLSFAWSISRQDHPYAQGVGVLVLALFVLHLMYASNHRKTILQSFAVARRSSDLARELQIKNIEFQELASARSRLLATVSHDLRQPAHAIGLLSERALADSTEPAVRDSLRDLNELSQSLSASLTTLMDLTRLDAGLVQPRMAPVSLAQLLAQLDAEFGASARAKGLGWQVARTPLWVQSDPVLLHGVLGNLVSNAIKYTRSGGVEIRVSQQGTAVKIEVCDSGVGIPATKLDLVFKEFVRLDASDAGTEGLGLGLSIVRRYASLMSHRLSVQSVTGEGSTFGISLERVDAPRQVPEASVPEPAERTSLHGLKVLVIDNVELLLVSMGKTLSAWGCEVRTARNLAEALDSARQEWPDVLVSDFHLGDREPDGLELIKTLRRQARLASRPHLGALLMTGDVSAQLEVRAGVIGVQVLHKPVRPQLLRESLQHLVDQQLARERQ